MACHVGLYFLSNSFLMKAAMSFSMLYFSSAWVAQSMASCCMSSAMSAFLITALRSAMETKTTQRFRLCKSNLIPNGCSLE
eukprot:CAMPEP_0171088166 /NCGR_PEP_ID=MMETSP0766_2-20121228/20613_1 /TAXON_ID=439317 /ORGANISM="Gambierdiscus australes, Strain CAWD 149" /LENGTH=80 /DNA_ID=CAMNT_0011545937 /DNA_START=232 /DNA_END=471 /DNA_ORIENTATION=+